MPGDASVSCRPGLIRDNSGPVMSGRLATLYQLLDQLTFAVYTESSACLRRRGTGPAMRYSRAQSGVGPAMRSSRAQTVHSQIPHDKCCFDKSLLVQDRTYHGRHVVDAYNLDHRTEETQIDRDEKKDVFTCQTLTVDCFI